MARLGRSFPLQPHVNKRTVAPTPWLNYVAITTPANGTTSHTVSPSSGTVAAGTLFTPTAGNFLVCVAGGSVTSTTPSGWTLPTSASAVGNTGLYAWTKTAAGSDSITTTHNGTSYQVGFAFFEYPAGTTFVSCVNATTLSTATANPTLSSLTGRNVVFAVTCGDDHTAAGPISAIWPSPNIEILDSDIDVGANDGYWLGIAYQNNYTTSSYAPLAAMTGNIGGSVTDRLTFALALPVGASGSTYTKTGSGVSDFTGHGADAVTTAETGAGVSAFTGHGADATTSAETGKGVSAFTGHGVKSYTSGSGLTSLDTDQVTDPEALGIAQQYQRKTFNTAGRWWLFYSDGHAGDANAPDMLVTSSADSGATWKTPAIIRSLDTAQEGSAFFDTHFDGTYVHYAAGGTAPDDITYRRGTPNSDGTITWSAAEQVAFPSAGGSLLECSITVDDSGHPWISWEDFDNAAVMVTTSSTTDGTWATDGSYPMQMDTPGAVSLQWWTFIANLGGGKIALVYYTTQVGSTPDLNQIYCRVYDGTAWGVDEEVDNLITEQKQDAISTNIAMLTNPSTGEVYVGWSDGFTSIAGTWFAVRDSGGSWSGEYITSDLMNGLALGLDPTSGDVHMVSITTGGTQVVNHWIRSGGLWTQDSDLTTSGTPIHVGGIVISEQSYGDEFIVAIQRQTSTTREVIEVYPIAVAGGGGGTTYTKTGAGVSAFTGHGADVFTDPETGKGVSDFTGHGADVVTSVETGAGVSSFTGHGADAVTSAETGAGVSAFTGSGADVSTSVEAGAGVSAFTAAGSRAMVFTKTGLGISVFTGHGADAVTSSETGAGVSVFTGSGADANISVESGTGISPFTGSGFKSSANVFIKTGSGVSVFTGHGADVSTTPETGAGISAFTGSGAKKFTYVESGAGVAVFTGGGGRAMVFNKTGAGVATATGSGAKMAIYAETGKGVLTGVGSGTKTYTSGSGGVQMKFYMIL